ncbi:MAG: hypothetical protein R2741_11175 [Methanolobus sp.]
MTGRESQSTAFPVNMVILLILVILAAIIVSYHGSGWIHFRKKRKELEDDIFSEDKGE